MYCKYCGKKIDDDAPACAQCAKQRNIPLPKKKKHGAKVAVLAVLVAAFPMLAKFISVFTVIEAKLIPMGTEDTILDIAQVLHNASGIMLIPAALAAAAAMAVALTGKGNFNRVPGILLSTTAICAVLFTAILYFTMPVETVLGWF